jgi:peptidyl-prolyl cis-trans isomerase SurA
MFKRLAALLLILGAAMGTFPSPAQAQVMDRIVASVNGEIITLRELTARADQWTKSDFHKQVDLGEPGSPDYQRKVLDIMIGELLTLQEARKRGIQLADQEVEAAIKNFKEAKKLNDETLKAELARQGSDLKTLKREIKFDMTRNRIMMQDIGMGIVVPDEEVDAFVRAHSQGAPMPMQMPSLQPDPGAPPLPGRVHIRSIAIELPSQPTPEQVEKIKAHVTRILRELQAGLDFQQAVAKYSEDPNASQGGDLGWMEWKDMHPQLRAVLELTQEGQFSPPLQTGPALQIFQVVEMDAVAREAAAKKRKELTAKTGAQGQGSSSMATIPPEEREKVRQMLMQQQLQQRFTDWVQGLKDKAVIDVTL